MTKYAIIETGGKQYKVQEGDELDVELLGTDSEKFTFDKVLLVGGEGTESKVGLPHVQGGKVLADVIGQVKGPKVIAFKYKRCKNYRRTVGHRQKYTRVRITEIAVA